VTDRPFVRVPLAISADGRPVGVVVYDSRDVNPAACRHCGATAYDERTLDLAVRWLVGHLRDEHGLRVLDVVFPNERPEAHEVARQVRAALRAPHGRRAA
jgi:hypothetical protein